MPFNSPTLQELVDANRARLEEALGGVDPTLRRSLTGALAIANSGAHYELFGFLSWIADQPFPDTVNGAELDRQAQPWGITRIPAAAASGTIGVRGAANSVLPEGTVWQDGQGVRFRSTAEVRLPANGVADAAVVAVDTGASGNLGAGTAMTLTSPIVGVESRATGIKVGGGSDTETDASLRSRWLTRRLDPPRGGTASDYQLWARSAHADVTRAWAQPLASGLGTVTVRFMTDMATANGIPSAATVQVVNDYIQERRPVTALVTVAAPVAVPLNVALRAVTPDTAAIRTAIEAEIADLILRNSAPGGTILVSQLREAISTAEGETDHELVSPLADVKVQAGQISVAGQVTYS